jgi:tetratricopeptide (TPR) repeat protein
MKDQLDNKKKEQMSTYDHIHFQSGVITLSFNRAYQRMGEVYMIEKKYPQAVDALKKSLELRKSEQNESLLNQAMLFAQKEGIIVPTYP